jgi:hypothetical protein
VEDSPIMDPSTKPDASPAPAPAPSTYSLAFKLAALGLVVVSALAGTGLARWLREPAPAAQPPQLALLQWPKPDTALVLTGQMHGYLLPCGCSHPQIGGLERRYNFLQMLRDKGWSLLPLDIGDVAQKESAARLPNFQGLIKYRYSMIGMDLMGYKGVGLGEYEAALPIDKALGEILNSKAPPVFAGNLPSIKEVGLAKDWDLIESNQVKVAVTAIIGSHTEAHIKDNTLKFSKSVDALTAIGKEMDAKKPDYRVVLYHGCLTCGKWAQGKESEPVEMAKAFPWIDTIICLTSESEPPLNPTVIKHANGRTTTILGVGHKGRYVGVLGLYRKGAAIETKWDVVLMTEDFKTPPEKAAQQPIVAMMEEYTKELRDHRFPDEKTGQKKTYLEMAPQLKHPSQLAFPGVTPVYVGHEKFPEIADKDERAKKELVCASCHRKAYDVWKSTPHSHAYQTLLDAKNPGNRQFDPECIVCHTVGYGYESGYRTAARTPKLMDVSCESCHGPCSEHVKKPDDAKWYPIINPFRAPEDEKPADKAKRHGRIGEFCMKCHDLDNDVTWSMVGFPAKWKIVFHPSSSDRKD